MFAAKLGPSLSDLRTSYGAAGFVLAKQLFSRDRLTGLCESLRTVLNKSPGNGSDQSCSLAELILKRESEDHNLVYRAAQSVGSSAATYALLGSSEIFDIIHAVTGFEKANLHVMPLYLIIQLPSDERFDYTWHQDGSYYSWCQDFLTLWFPVNRDIKRNTGTISLIPGSHRYGPRETDTFLKHGFFKQIQSKLLPDEENGEEVLEVDLGDCCIMSGNTVHRSIANQSCTPRVAGVLRLVNLGSQVCYERERLYCTHKS
jgi:hypothetical protein